MLPAEAVWESGWDKPSDYKALSVWPQALNAPCPVHVSLPHPELRLGQKKTRRRSRAAA